MANQAPVQDDPEQLEHAHMLWTNFLSVAKYGIIGVAALLLIMALIFVQF